MIHYLNRTQDSPIHYPQGRKWGYRGGADQGRAASRGEGHPLRRFVEQAARRGRVHI